MTDKELKRMSRSDLLEMLISQMEENEKLRTQLRKAEKELKSRQINLSKAGSIAEAALALNGVFQAAEDAAAQYLENIRIYSEKHEEVGRRIEEQARKKADAIIAEAEEYKRKVYQEKERGDKEKAERQKKEIDFLDFDLTDDELGDFI